MTEDNIRLVIGGLLHDIGKVIYRCGDGRNHSTSGYDFLKNAAELKDKEILDQIRFHHAGLLKDASISTSSMAYITYQADNIASGTDRREGLEKEDGFDKETPLESIFNLLNGNRERMHYPSAVLNSSEICYPTDEPVSYDESFYSSILENIKDGVKGIVYNEEYLNSLEKVMEANLSFIPSSTSKREVADISLFDHAKLTAALGCCICEYLKSQGIEDYKTALFTNGKEFYEQKAFLIYGLDVSGIQNFIYTINSKGALKSLRARSFYLEITMEHIIDEFLAGAGLARVNLLYSGGGHAYILLPNTSQMKDKIEQFQNDINQWFLQYFRTSLYLAGGCAVCSANDLKNEPQGSYSNIFREVSTQISSRKTRRYSPEEILALNHQTESSGERECSVCHRTDRLLEENKCDICHSLEMFSKKIMTDQFFTVFKENDKTSLPLPGGYYLTANKKMELISRMGSGTYVRAYMKNELHTGKQMATNLWVGDYAESNLTDELAGFSTGIERLGVLRADVDNLGQAFVSGFERDEVGERYVTISRTAAFSRKLSLFFKLHMNHLLQKGSFYLEDRAEGEPRKAMIVYSGGDDVFVVGSWDDIIGFAVDLYCGLKRFSQNTLTISAGIGIFPEKYPISAIAREVGILEEASKKIEGKNAVTLFLDKNHTYHWEVFIDRVLGEKYRLIYRFFENSSERGKSFLYKLIDLMTEREEKINLARYAYILARLAPDKKEEEQVILYQEFSRKMYQWMKDEEDCRQAITSMYLYAYLTRSREEDTNGETK